MTDPFVFDFIKRSVTGPKEPIPATPPEPVGNNRCSHDWGGH